MDLCNFGERFENLDRILSHLEASMPNLPTSFAKHALECLIVSFTNVSGCAASEAMHVNPNHFCRSLVVVDELVGTHDYAMLS